MSVSHGHDETETRDRSDQWWAEMLHTGPPGITFSLVLDCVSRLCDHLPRPHSSESNPSLLSQGLIIVLPSTCASLSLNLRVSSSRHFSSLSGKLDHVSRTSRLCCIAYHFGYLFGRLNMGLIFCVPASECFGYPCQ